MRRLLKSMFAHVGQPPSAVRSSNARQIISLGDRNRVCDPRTAEGGCPHVVQFSSSNFFLILSLSVNNSSLLLRSFSTTCIGAFVTNDSFASCRSMFSN